MTHNSSTTSPTLGYSSDTSIPALPYFRKANGDGKKKIWATEWGAPTGASAQSVTEAEQAQLVTAALTRLKAWRWAGPSFFYSFRDKGTNPVDRERPGTPSAGRQRRVIDSAR